MRDLAPFAPSSIGTMSRGRRVERITPHNRDPYGAANTAGNRERGGSASLAVPTEESDDELLVRVAGGDGVAFARLVSRHRARLIAVATRIIRNRAIAEEVVQETLTRAWIQAPRWRKLASEKSTLSAWLRRVTTNLAIDQTRRARAVSLDGAPEPIDPEIAPDAKMIDAEDQRRLAAALQALPPRQRAAIALTYDEGLSNAEGALAMETSIGAFELLLVRARRTLRQAMTEDKGQ